MHKIKSVDEPKYYCTISKLPLCRFIDAVCDDNPHALTISGAPELGQLIAAWEGIFEEFTEEIGDQEMRLFKNVSVDFHKLKFRYDQTQILIDALDQFRLQSQANSYREMVRDLNAILKTTFTFNHTDAGFDRMLQNCRTRSGSMLINLGIKKAAFEAMQAKQTGTGAKMDKKYFVAQLIALSDHAKYAVTDQITVLEYCTRIKNINVFLEQHNKAKK